MSHRARITRIAIEGGSARVPTGALQFENDWPGLFLRGDAAIPLAVNIRELEKRLRDVDDIVVVSALRHLAEVADIIETQVIV